MSRTDGHAPYWTWATWYEPWHGLWCNRRYDCNLPAKPVRHAGRGPNLTTGRCTWEPVWPARYADVKRLFGHGSPPRWFVRHVWNSPERVRERDQLGKMVKEYNATGGIEDGDFANYRPRHSARWLWD